MESVMFEFLFFFLATLFMYSNSGVIYLGDYDDISIN